MFVFAFPQWQTDWRIKGHFFPFLIVCYFLMSCVCVHVCIYICLCNTNSFIWGQSLQDSFFWLPQPKKMNKIKCSIHTQQKLLWNITSAYSVVQQLHNCKYHAVIVFIFCQLRLRGGSTMFVEQTWVGLHQMSSLWFCHPYAKTTTTTLDSKSHPNDV